MGKLSKIEVFWLGIVGVIALFAMFPLLGSGFIPTHDGEYHIIRFWQFSRVLSEGHVFPRWAPDLNSGYGIPLFIFHYPFPNYIGFLLHVAGLSFVDSFKVALALGYFLAIGACYLWVSRWVLRRHAAVATIIFATIPYWFVDIYVRGSIGEVWAIAWFFVVLSAVEHSLPLVVSAAFAFLVLSHNIMAMVLAPILLCYTMVRGRRLIGFLFVGLLLSAYFWIPALVERVFVTGLNSVNFADHFPLLVQLLFPSWGTGFSVRQLTSDEMSFQIGLVPLIVVTLSFLRRASKEALPVYRLFLLVAAIGLLLMLEISKPLWEALPFLPFIQYPWRLLAVMLPVTAFLAARVAASYPGWVGVSLAVLSVFASKSYMRPVVYAPRSDSYYLTRPEFTDGTSSIGNTFSTVWTPWKKDRPKAKIDVVAGTATIHNERIRATDSSFTIESVGPSIISMNTLFYPGWKLSIDAIPREFENTKTGILRFTVPDGTHKITIAFGETPFRKMADSISFLSLLWLSVWAILKVIKTGIS